MLVSSLDVTDMMTLLMVVTPAGAHTHHRHELHAFAFWSRIGRGIFASRRVVGYLRTNRENKTYKYPEDAKSANSSIACLRL